jgi:organic hydroperoxide reductase OsmC/OhrA
MRIAATLKNSADTHLVSVRTGEATQALSVPRAAAGPGSGVNGGEFLMLALATCYCNDLYREAQRLGVHIQEVEVEATAQFPVSGLRQRTSLTPPGSAARPPQNSYNACCTRRMPLPKCTTRYVRAFR